MTGCQLYPAKAAAPFLRLFFFAFSAAAVVASSSCALFRQAGVGMMPPDDRAFYDAYAHKFGIRFTGGESKELIRAVDRWLGVPYRFGGCSRTGVDCSCFVQSLYARVYGIALRRTARDMFHDAQPVAAADLREGDLVFLKKPGGRISHVGVYLAQGRFAHVSKSRGVMISSLQEDYYQKHFFAGGRVQGIGQGLSSR